MMIQSVSTFASDRVISVSQLPAPAKAFVSQNFPGQTISYAKIDNDFFGATYEVCLNNGVEVDFDNHGVWDNVDCKYSAVPAKLIPANIANYVNINFKGATIVKIDKEHYGYEVELSNGLDPKFNRNGSFMMIDD